LRISCKRLARLQCILRSIGPASEAWFRTEHGADALVGCLRGL